MNKVKITVNGITPEHIIGDLWYMVDFINGGFTFTVPKNPKITKHTAIFTVKGTVLEKHFINGMTYANGAFRYRVANEDWYIAEEDFGKTVFFTYEEAKAIRDKFEEEYYKEDIYD